MTSTITYTGELRTVATHLESGTEILTDAPKDNHGKGEAFSPTDLVATALGSCMVSIMGIKARQMDISIDGTKVEVTKVMYAEPRRIGEIIIAIYMPANGYTDKDKKILEHAAMTCPVFLSLHPDIKKDVSVHW
jgi:uncharacterized OsmC-like protein